MVNITELKRQAGINPVDVELARRYAVQAFIDKWVSLDDVQRDKLLEHVERFNEKKKPKLQATVRKLAA